MLSVSHVQVNRIRRVVMKLARGHAAYELYPRLEKPLEVTLVPLPMLSGRETFEDVTSGRLDLWPELGSRAYFSGRGKNPDQFEERGDWIMVQLGRYRYAVVETSGVLVRMVLSEYLVCQITWE